MMQSSLGASTPLPPEKSRRLHAALRRLGPFALGALAAIAPACGGQRTTEPVPVTRVEVSAPTTTLRVGQTVQLTATPRDAGQNPLPDRRVRWSSSDTTRARVDSTGRVTAIGAGTVTITATAERVSASVTLNIVAADAGCAPTGGVTLAVGEARLLSAEERLLLCVRGSGGSEYTLVPFHATRVAGARIQIEVAGEQVVAATGPPNPSVTPLGNRAGTVAPERDLDFELTLRESERRELTSLMPSARTAQVQRRELAQFSRATPPQVGDILSLNTQSSSACSNPTRRGGRIAAVTQHAIVVADTGNPAGGFTDDEYRAFGIAFDTLVYPVDTENFGTPTDIDKNGKVIIFFTRAVNELTEPNSSSFVGGFFFGRDLFPRAKTAEYAGCEGSNEAELFYQLVPDPSGTINGNVREKAFVQRITVGTIAHEFQHLINAGRRLYVNRAPTFEEVWLNEGLSHIAEELVFYRAAGLGPRRNLDIETLRSSQRIFEATNAYQLSNLGRLSQYLKATETTSPFATNDELGTRGAAWQLLRYATDRKGGEERPIWFALVNSQTAGLDNFGAVYGDPLPIIRDWANANYTDDAVPGVPAVLTHPSWNFRSVLAALRTNDGRYPLATRPLGTSTTTLSLVGGGAAYLRFGVASETVGAVRTTSQGNVVPSSVVLTLIRTR